MEREWYVYIFCGIVNTETLDVVRHGLTYGKVKNTVAVYDVVARTASNY
jgi:hypothetical protein